MLTSPIARIGDVIVYRDGFKKEIVWQGVVEEAKFIDDMWLYNKSIRENEIVGVFSSARQYFENSNS